MVPSSADTRATTGEVISFLVDGVSVGTAPLNAGVATLTINSIAVGKHSLTASFAGDVNFAAAVTAPTVPYRVFPAVAPTTTALSVLVNGVSASTIAPGTTVTLMATVTERGKLVYPGTINFCEARAATCTGAALYGTAQLNASGVAILKRQFGAGGYTILANFMGNTGFATSASVSIPLSASNSTATAISYSGVPGNYNLTATVSSTGTLVSPTGRRIICRHDECELGLRDGHACAGSTTQSFTAGTGLTGLPTPTIFVAGDFNGDGKTDLVYANSGTYNGTSSTLGLLQNNGDGTYTSKLIANYSYNTVTLLVGDFNNDGFLDVAVPGNGNILLYLGKGDGTFTAAPTPTYVRQAAALQVARSPTSTAMAISISSSTARRTPQHRRTSCLEKETAPSPSRPAPPPLQSSTPTRSWATSTAMAFPTSSTSKPTRRACCSAMEMVPSPPCSPPSPQPPTMPRPWRTSITMACSI